MKKSDVQKAQKAKFDKIASENDCVGKMTDGQIPISEGDEFTFKGSDVDDMIKFDTFKDQAGKLRKWAYLVATNGTRVSQSNLAKRAANGLNLSGASAPERFFDLCCDIITSGENGYTIRVAQIKETPSNRKGEIYKTIIWEKA